MLVVVVSMVVVVVSIVLVVVSSKYMSWLYIPHSVVPMLMVVPRVHW